MPHGGLSFARTGAVKEGQREGDGGKEARLEPRDEGRFGPIVLWHWEMLDPQQQGSFRSAIVTC